MISSITESLCEHVFNILPKTDRIDSLKGLIGKHITPTKTFVFILVVGSSAVALGLVLKRVLGSPKTVARPKTAESKIPVPKVARLDEAELQSWVKQGGPNEKRQEAAEIIRACTATLSLVDLNLTTLPKTIGDLPDLETFHIIDKSLQSLPDSIEKLKNLKRLVLFCNSLNSLPDFFGEFAKLEIIYLESNKITTLPNSFRKLKNLKELTLWYCEKLVSLPDFIGELVNLNKLTLHRCSIITSLPDSIGNLKKLKNFNLSLCYKIKIIPDSINNLKECKISQC